MCFVWLTAYQLSASEQSVTTKAWAVLDAGLHDQKAGTRIEAISALGIIPGNRRAIETAEQALQDPNSDVCRAAISALGEMNSTGSMPKIKALISRSDAKTVVAIAAVLTKFKDPEGYEIYYEILTGKRKGGGSILDGIKDKKALETMGVESAIGFLPGGGEITGAYEYFRRNDSEHSHRDVIAVTALARDPDPRAKQALVQAAFGGKQAVQVAALRALATRDDSAVVNEIEPAMYSGKPVIRYTAAAAIVHLLDVRKRLFWR